MLVLMALVTTFATTPVLHFITRGFEACDEEAESAADESPPAGGGLLVPVSNPAGAGALLDLAAAATHRRTRRRACWRWCGDRPAASARACARSIAKSRRARRCWRRRSIIARAVGAAIDAQALWTDDAGRRHPGSRSAADHWLAAARLSPSGVRRRSARRRRQGGARRHERARGQRRRRHPRPRARPRAHHRRRRRLRDGKAGLELAARIVAKQEVVAARGARAEQGRVEPAAGARGAVARGGARPRASGCTRTC